MQERYDVAISFGSADIKVAEEIRQRLRRRGVSVYLYVHTPEETLGADLVATLRFVYSTATLVVSIVSAHYNTEHTRVELEAALSGEAANGGVIPVRVDDAPLPEPLQRSAWWSIAQGTDGLINALLAKLRRRPLTTPWVLMACLALSAVLGVYVLGVLGFRSLRRWPDAAFHIAIVAPLAWVGFTRTLPHLIGRRRARRLRGTVLLQTPLLRAIEFSSSYLIAAVFVIGVVASAYATVVARDVRTAYAMRSIALATLESRWTDLHGMVVTLDGIAARAATAFLPNDREKSAELSAIFQTKLDQAKTLGSTLHDSLSDSTELASDDLGVLLECSQTILRVLDRYIGHQVIELARPPTNGQSADSDLVGRKAKADLIISYGVLLHSTLKSADDAYAALRVSLEKHQSSWSRRWAGVVQTAVAVEQGEVR